MRYLLIALIVVACAVLALAAYVRLAASDPETWHTDPSDAVPAMGHFVVKPEGGDTAGPLLAVPPADALAAFDAIALATPRTSRLVGAPDEGKVTYITRSRLWGFPDYTTVAAEAVEGGTRLNIHARLRFGSSDMGVNAARVQSWLDALER